jgi:hypothetical protein
MYHVILVKPNIMMHTLFCANRTQEIELHDAYIVLQPNSSYKKLKPKMAGAGCYRKSMSELVHYSSIGGYSSSSWSWHHAAYSSRISNTVAQRSRHLQRSSSNSYFLILLVHCVRGNIVL